MANSPASILAPNFVTGSYLDCVVSLDYARFGMDVAAVAVVALVIVAAMIACDLLRWLRLLCLNGPLVKTEPKTPHYRLRHTAVRLVCGQRKREIKIPETWPWAPELDACFHTVFALAPP